jgi:NADPH:quinone reductase-like Zn-dependent oxidoreductase
VKAIQFDHFGGPEVLEIREVERPAPTAGEVLVAIRAAAINPGEISIREGLLEARWPTTFPCGEGSDLAGTIEIPIDRTFPLAEVREAYRELAKRATRGKIVLLP